MMSSTNLIAGTACLLFGLLLLALSIPLIRGKVGMNRLYGVRFKVSFSSEDNWYKINRYGGKLMAYWAGIIMALGLVCFLVPALSEAAVIGLIALITIFTIIPCWQSYRYARTLTE